MSGKKEDRIYEDIRFLHLHNQDVLRVNSSFAADMSKVESRGEDKIEIADSEELAEVRKCNTLGGEKQTAGLKALEEAGVKNW